MVRFIALVALLLVATYGYETYANEDFGVRRTVNSFINYGFAGGYGIATGVTSSVGGAIGGVLGR